MPVYNPVGYVAGCAERSVKPAVGNGVILTLLMAMQNPGAMSNLPMAFALNCGAVYGYFVVQCPMEAIHGRQSLLHNVAAGGTLGYLGVASGRVGIPFNLEPTFYINRIPLPVGGALVYGGLAAVFGAIGGKAL